MSSLRIACWVGAAVLAPLVLAPACHGNTGGTTATGAGGGSGAAGGGGPGGGGGTGGEGASLPDGLFIQDLSAPVDAAYDEHGILHLTCATDDDCYAALGYFHADNRFFFMDFVRNLVRGSLGSLVKGGNAVLETDYENRRFFTTAAGEPLEVALHDNASDLVKGHIAAFTRGVNAWLRDMRQERNGATLTTEYDFALIVKDNIRDWEPADTTAIGLYVLNDLSNNVGAELMIAEQAPALDAALAADLFTHEPVYDAFTYPALLQSNAAAAGPLAPWANPVAGAGARLSPLRALLGDARVRLERVGRIGKRPPMGEHGSNNWLVSPSRTAGGHALLADDPHLQLTNPSIWFAVEIDARTAGDGDYHVAGSTFPGLPSVMVGHNEQVGWGVTTAYYDLTDAYVEELSEDGTKVMFEGGEVDIVEKDFTFVDATLGRQVTQTFRYVPHHGPIVSEDLDAGTAISVRWAPAAGDPGTDLDAFFALARAGTVEEAKTALQQQSYANQNFIVVDNAGNVGWYPYAKIPRRPWSWATSPPWLPLPGDGSAEWDGVVAPAALPTATNPPAGAIATANQDLTGASEDGDVTNDGNAPLHAISKAEGTRLQRILDLLEAGGDEHTVETMTDMQLDTYSLYGSVLTPLVLAAAEDATLSGDEENVIAALEAWAYTCPTGLDGNDPETAGKSTDDTEAAESIGCSAFHTVLYATLAAALGDEAAEAEVDLFGRGSGNFALHLMMRALRDPGSIASGDALWDDVSTTGVTETRDDVLLAGLAAAAEALAAFGEPDDWRWGRLHTLTLASVYDNFGVVNYNDGPYAAPGGQYTVNVANPTEHDLPEGDDPLTWAFGSGPSVRFVVEARPEGCRMTYQLPGGNDLHRESDFYNNLLPSWLEGTSIAFPFAPDAFTPALERQVLPEPDL